MPKPIQHFNLTQQNCAMAHFRMHNEHFIVLETPGGDYQAVQFIMSEQQFKQLLKELTNGELAVCGRNS